MIQIHLYEKGDSFFPKFPVNSYCTDDAEKAATAVIELLKNHRSGISKVVIENDEFGDTTSVADPQAIMGLDK